LGIPEWIGIIIIGCVSVVYTALAEKFEILQGGIKAVIWSDVFQSAFILIGLVALILKPELESGSAHSTDSLVGHNRGHVRLDSLVRTQPGRFSTVRFVAESDQGE
uniref:Sodium:proline symporter n=1 Tax=Macrostomum lignano TaxID=282301 RepID=A0A1I8HV50_9PLAT